VERELSYQFKEFMYEINFIRNRGAQEFHLPFFDHVHGFDPFEYPGSGTKGLES
jgi:hypothetical protein